MSYICCLIPKIWPHLSFGPACFIPHSFLFSCPLSPLFLFGSPVISSSFLYHTRLTCFCYSFIPSSIFLWVPIRSSFIPTLFLFPSSLPSFLSLFLPSGDAAKRKAWKLNRVSSLRSIYTNSLQNSEGKKKNCCGGTDRPPTDLHPYPPTTAGLESPVLEICAFDSRNEWVGDLQKKMMKLGLSHLHV